MMRFKRVCWSGKEEEFDLDTLPPYLSRRDDSIMDMSWYVDGYLKKLDVGESIEADFCVYTRVA
jgi:hypothetical protein